VAKGRITRHEKAVLLEVPFSWLHFKKVNTTLARILFTIKNKSLFSIISKILYVYITNLVYNTDDLD